MTDTAAVLAEACRAVGLVSSSAVLIRSSENDLYRLLGGVVARVTRAGQLDAARKEVRVSGWLRSSGVPVIEALATVQQPIEVEGRAVTFWHELPPHRKGTIVELAGLLKLVHALPLPDFELPTLAPFVRLRERIAESTVVQAHHQDWLLGHLAGLEVAYGQLPPGRPWCAVHGDAWDGNVAVTAEGPVLLDLERFACGPPEWDLASVAVDCLTFWGGGDAWADFCAHYGQDVTTWPGFEVLRDARELRKVTFAFQMVETRPHLLGQAQYRLACIRGERGERPWGWVGVG